MLFMGKNLYFNGDFPVRYVTNYQMVNGPMLPLILWEIHPIRARASTRKWRSTNKSSTERAYGVKAWELGTAKIGT